MNDISEIIYQIESACNEDYLDLNELSCIQASRYLVNNLTPNHQMPGNIYWQFLGVIDWYREKRFITPKQHSWLKYNLCEYIGERDLILEQF